MIPRLAAAAFVAWLPAAPRPADVTLTTIDREGLSALRENHGAKLRLVSVWATWCAPCLAELPDIVGLDREFRESRFETVTVSADEANRHAQALAALRRANASTLNRRFVGEAPELALSLDPTWDGGLPFALLIAPGGKVLLRSEGMLDVDGAREVIRRWLRAP